MIRNLIILTTWAAIIAMAGVLWSLVVLASDPGIAPWPATVATGAAGALAGIGIPLAVAFLVAYAKHRGRHAAPIQRSRSRYVKVTIR